MSNSQIKNIVRSQNGNGIIQAILIIALILTNGFLGLKFVSNNFNDVRNWSIFRSKTDIKRNIAGVLRASENCLATFNAVNSATTNLTINSIKGTTGVNLFESINANADARYGSGRFQILDMKLKDFSAHTFDPNSQTANFSVNLVGGDSRNHSLEYPMIFTYDGAGTLINCSYIDESTTVWKKNASGDLYLNSSAGVGHPQVSADFMSWGDLVLRNQADPNLSSVIRRSYWEASNGTSFVVDASGGAEDPVIFSTENNGGAYFGYSFAKLSSFPLGDGVINIRSTNSPHLRFRKPNATTGWNMDARTSEMVWEYKNNDGSDAAGSPSILIKTDNSALNAFRDFRVGEVSNFGLNFYVDGAAGGTTNYTNFSDKRLKENFKFLNSKDSLNKIKKLKIYNYRLKSGYIKDQKQVGVMAQEVLDYAPEVVSQSSEGYYTVNYSEFIPLTSSAMKEVDSKIKASRRRLDKLLSNIDPVASSEKSVGH